MLFNLPVQLNPSPLYPLWQVHEKLPGVFLQSANSLQPPLLDEHSSISEKMNSNTNINLINAFPGSLSSF